MLHTLKVISLEIKIWREFHLLLKIESQVKLDIGINSDLKFDHKRYVKFNLTSQNSVLNVK